MSLFWTKLLDRSLNRHLNQDWVSFLLGLLRLAPRGFFFVSECPHRRFPDQSRVDAGHLCAIVCSCPLKGVYLCSLLMKTVAFRLTDKQHHYLAAVAKDQRRSVEHLVWLALAQGIDYMFNEECYYVEKLQCDFTDGDVESMKHGTEYYGDHPWADSIADNVLDDCERTFE